MKMLGLNPMEQDIMDLCNTVPRNGLIYFPDFCAIVLKRWREEDEEVFRQNMFKVRFILPFLRFILTDICSRSSAAQNPSPSCIAPRNTNLMITSSPRMIFGILWSIYPSRKVYFHE